MRVEPRLPRTARGWVIAVAVVAVAIAILVGAGPGWLLCYLAAALAVWRAPAITARLLPSAPQRWAVAATVVAVNALLVAVLAATGWLFSSSSAPPLSAAPAGATGAGGTTLPTTTVPGTPPGSLDPYNLGQLTAAAQLAQASQDTTEAVVLWQDVVDIDPDAANLLALGTEQVAAGNADAAAAVSTFELALAASPGSAAASFGLGQALELEGGVADDAAAMRELQLAVDAQPSNATYRSALATAQLQLAHAVAGYPEATSGVSES